MVMHVFLLQPSQSVVKPALKSVESRKVLSPSSMPAMQEHPGMGWGAGYMSVRDAIREQAEG